MLHSPIRLSDSVDHQCGSCAQIERAPARHLPESWLILLANDGRSQSILCSDCAPAAMASALAEINRQTLPIVRGTCRATDEAIYASADIDLVKDLGADEIDRVSIAIECEELFGIHLSDDDISRVNTLGDLNKAIFDQLTTSGRSAAQ